MHIEDLVLFGFLIALGAVTVVVFLRVAPHSSNDRGSFVHASMIASDVVSDNRYHVAAAFINISGMTVPPVNKSTIGYCSPSDGSFPLPLITVLPRD
jgi:hypothetical protein